MLTGEQWDKILLEGANRMPVLKESKIRLIPYGTEESLEVLGECECQMTAEAGAETTTMIYIVRGMQESLLGLRDGEALGMLKINIGGDIVGTDTDPQPRVEMAEKHTQEHTDQSRTERKWSQQGGKRKTQEIQSWFQLILGGKKKTPEKKGSEGKTRRGSDQRRTVTARKMEKGHKR